MNENHIPTDIILLCVDSPIAFPQEAWDEVRAELESRLGGTVLLVLGAKDCKRIEIEWDDRWEEWERAEVQRILLLSIGNSQRLQSLLSDSFLWSYTRNRHTFDCWCPKVFIAPPWDPADWAELLLAAQQPDKDIAWNLIVPFPGPVDPVEEDRLGYYGEGIRNARHEVAELVWELRRRGASADFKFKSPNAQTKSADENIQQSKSIKSEKDVQFWLHWNPGSKSSDSNKTYVAMEDEAELSFIRVETLDARYRVASHRVIPIKNAVAILVTKLLLASSDGELHGSMPSSSNASGDRGDEAGKSVRAAKAILDDSYPELLHTMSKLLPSKYSGHDHHVNPRSMGSAKLQSEEFGVVPWGDIWTSYCELALAGGPPHRGRLLEPVDPDSILKDLPGYQLVVEELTRGIFLAAGLQVTETATLGWVGIHCDSEEMAGWMVRSMNAENVVARREEYMLFVPAGPDFTIKREIKNVITSVSKSAYYWRQQPRSL